MFMRNVRQAEEVVCSAMKHKRHMDQSVKGWLAPSFFVMTIHGLFETQPGRKHALCFFSSKLQQPLRQSAHKEFYRKYKNVLALDLYILYNSRRPP